MKKPDNHNPHDPLAALYGVLQSVAMLRAAGG